MYGVLSLMSVVAESAVASVSKWKPLRAEVLETVAGVMLLGGFGLLGSALTHFC